LPPSHPQTEKDRARGTSISLGLLGGAVAGLAEITIVSLGGWVPGPALTLKHVTWLLCIGLLIGLVTYRRPTTRLTARVWLLLPCLVALSPLLARRFGVVAALVLPAAALLAAIRLPPVGRESVVAGALAGSLVGVRLGYFFAMEYDGRATSPGALLTVALTAVLAAAIYLLGTRIRFPRRNAAVPLHLSLALLLCVVSVALAWAGRSPLPARINAQASIDESPPVVIVVLDTARADHLALYGYSRDTMPNLSSFARQEAVTVERAITNAPDSLASHASLFTGLFPVNHGAHRPLLIDTTTSFGYALRDDVPTMASAFRDHGYATLAVSANFGPISAEIGLGLERGFDVYRSHPEGACRFTRRSPWRPVGQWAGRAFGATAWLPECVRRYRQATDITDEAVSLIDAAGESSFLLFVNYMDAHSPYMPPPAFRDRFPGYDPAFAEREPPGPPATGQIDLPPEHAAHLISQYDAELAYLDNQLARLLERLRQHPAWDEMLVVITADHGEAFGEHGLMDHSSSLYDVMIRVPLIIKLGRLESGAPEAGGRWRRPFQLVDVMPLALAQAGLEIPAGLDGRSPATEAGPLRAWSFPARAKMDKSDFFARELRSIEMSGWKLIEDHTGRTELYQLAEDPGELTDRAGEFPERVSAMLEAMGPWTSYRVEHRPAGNLSPEALERLRALGYVR